MPDIYLPSDDSYFLSENLKKVIDKNILEGKILDMGAGTGIQAETIVKSRVNLGNLTLTDINPEVIDYLLTKFPKSNIIKSNLFSNIKGKFDLIVFNPPYLPENKFDKKKDTTGGKKGSEIINKFLKQAKKHLNKDGKIILLTSSLTKKINWLNYKKRLLGKKKLFFEKLYVWEITV